MNPKDIPHECVCAVCNEPMVSASDYAGVKADNARLAIQVKACQDLVHVALPPEGKREPWPVCLNNLLAPVEKSFTDLWQILVMLKRDLDPHPTDANKYELSRSAWDEAVTRAEQAKPQLDRLRALIEIKP